MHDVLRKYRAKAALDIRGDDGPGPTSHVIGLLIVAFKHTYLPEKTSVDILIHPFFRAFF